jgi:hypothetical protein
MCMYLCMCNSRETVRHVRYVAQKLSYSYKNLRPSAMAVFVEPIIILCSVNGWVGPI